MRIEIKLGNQLSAMPGASDSVVGSNPADRFFAVSVDMITSFGEVCPDRHQKNKTEQLSGSAINNGNILRTMLTSA